MADLTVDPTDVAPVEVRKQITAPSAAVIARGQLCRMDADGKWTPARTNDATGAGNVRGISMTDADPAGEAVTCVQKGLVDLGPALDGLAIGAAVFGSDTAGGGALGDAAGTVSVTVGRVVGNYGATAVQRLLDVDL